MNFIAKFFGKRPKLTGLKLELANLQKQIIRTDRHLEEMSDEFWRSGGVCCPSCGMPGYSELMWKQERRELRVKQIEKKLNSGAIAQMGERDVRNVEAEGSIPSGSTKVEEDES